MNAEADRMNVENHRVVVQQEAPTDHDTAIPVTPMIADARIIAPKDSDPSQPRTVALVIAKILVNEVNINKSPATI